MKHFILILFLSLFLFNTSKAEVKDTVKIIQKLSCDKKQPIIQKLFTGFMYAKFDSLVIFCSSYVEFYIIQDEERTIYRSLTDYGLVNELDNIFRGVNYSKFRISSGKNIKNEEVILVKLFFMDGYETPDINVYFILSSLETIKSVVIQ